MKTTRCLRLFRLLAIFLGGSSIGLTACGQQLNAIGVTLLRSVVTNADGTGVRVAQPEAQGTNIPPDFEVNPGNASVQQPTSLFTYINTNGSVSSFPNSLGTESGHADDVAGNFYGTPSGVATNVAHVDNYNGSFFYAYIIAAILPTNIYDRVVNQSFIFGYVPSEVPVSQQQQLDSQFDNYAAQYNTLFVSGAGNGGPGSGTVAPPSTCYNGISVGAYGYAGSSVGPTEDNGRAKPDITAPAGATSFSTPQVAGAAAVLMQTGLRGDGGNDTNAVADIRTVKALLLNGAVKPADWTNDPPSPLDPRYGAGILNVFNSYEQLAGGEHGYIVATSVPSGGAHPPPGATGSLGALSGWDFNTNTSGTNSDEINHYYFDVTNGGNAAFTATATLVWNRQQNQGGINNLDLFLYNAANSNLVICSTSMVDNVEQVFVPQLAPGRYDLQVWKAGGIPGMSIVSFSETYALAWEFSSTFLTPKLSNGNLLLSWPIYPDGFVLASATNLATPVVWSTNTPLPVVTNGQNWILVSPTNASQFFRLQPP
ncbi:MAG TPA: S8 family serine peptidase [Candidatus Saccharimonadales bacterium]|nr:S8 family serine peptidase [Candidatus Saccharimonadales bacterium]